MSIVLNEREFARDAIQRCSLESKPLETLRRVSRYYHSEGYKKKEIRSLLETFMLKCDPTINIVKWSETIDRLVKDSDKYDLIEIESVPITKAELDVCENLNGKQMQRLMFTLICLAKFGDMVNEKNNGWVSRPDKEIFKMANIVTSIKRQSLMLNDLREKGLIKFSHKIDNIHINVTCLDNSGEAVMQITDFRNLGYQFMRYQGEPCLECESCGLVIKRTKNVQKYCDNCAIEMNRQKARERFRSKALAS